MQISPRGAQVVEEEEEEVGVAEVWQQQRGFQSMVHSVVVR